MRRCARGGRPARKSMRKRRRRARWPAGGASAGDRSGRAGLVVLGQGDGEFQHLVPAVALDVDVDRFDVHVDIFLDHFEQLVAQQRQVVGRSAGGALLRHDDAQALLGHHGGRLRPALEEIKNTHRVKPPNTRWKKPFFCTSRKRSGRSSPRMRATVSLYAWPACEFSSRITGTHELDAASTFSDSGMTPTTE